MTALTALGRFFKELPHTRSIEVQPLGPLATLRYQTFDVSTPKIFSLEGYNERTELVTYLVLLQLKSIPLSELKLSGNKIDTRLCLEVLQKASSLKKLILHDIHDATLTSILEVLGRFCFQLEVCHFHDVFTSHGLDFELLHACSKIHELSFVNCLGLLEQKLNAWLSSEKRSLNRLTFADCLDIQMSTLRTLRDNPLRYLSITRCAHLDGTCFEQLASLPLSTFHFNGMSVKYSHFLGCEAFFGRLQALSLADSDLTPESVGWLAEHCKNVNSLCLKGNQQIDRSSLLKLANLPHLKYLDMRETHCSAEELKRNDLKIIDDNFLKSL